MPFYTLSQMVLFSQPSWCQGLMPNQLGIYIIKVLKYYRRLCNLSSLFFRVLFLTPGHTQRSRHEQRGAECPKLNNV